jgi:hypothetical protein
VGGKTVQKLLENLLQMATLEPMSAEVAQALVTAVIAIFAVVIVISLARRQLLTFRYAAGWCVLLLLTALSGVLIPLVAPVAKSLSTTPGTLVSASGIAILVLICIQLSVSISGLQKQIQKLAEDIAIREAINGSENDKE